MENANELSSSLSFASSSYLSNGSSCQNVSSTAGSEPGISLELLSLSKLSGSLEKLVIDADYDYSDVEIVVEDKAVGVHRCILAARSPFFHQLFKKGDYSSAAMEGKPRYLMSNLVPYGRVGYEAFMVVLNYLYTGKLNRSPPEVSTCVHSSCAHDACGPAINYAVELMYASSTFQMKELVMLVQRRLQNFIEKAFVEDVIPILQAAYHCELSQLRLHCVQRVARSDLDTISLEKELPSQVASEIKSLQIKSQKHIGDCTMEIDPANDKKISNILKALDSDDIELVKLLLEESDITLDYANGLHYAAAYCDPKIVSELLNLGLVDLNRRNSRGYTVLHVAARRKDPSVIVGLLNEGARVLDTTLDGQTAVTICRRLTRPKEYNEKTKKGEESNKERICIDVLEREMRRNPMAGNISVSSMVVADDLHMNLILLEDRVAFARILFPAEARLAMKIAHADTTAEFAGFSASNGLCWSSRDVDLNEMPSEEVERLQSRLAALKKTVETGRRFFPHCSEVLDNFLVDMDVDMPEALFLEKGTQEEKRMKQLRYVELKAEVMKAFDKDKAEHNWPGPPPGVGFSSSCSSSSSPKVGPKHKARKRL